MTPLELDLLRRLLPDLDEVRPLLDRMVSRSEPDPSRIWAGSGRLGTVGQRSVDPEDIRHAARELADEAHRHLQVVYGQVGEAASRLQDGDSPGAARALLELCEREQARGAPDRAAAWADAAYRALEGHTDPALVSLVRRRRARADWARGHLDDARRDYAEAYRQAELATDRRGAAEAAVGAGNVLEEQGRWEDAERWYRDALDQLAEVEGAVPERWHALLNVHIALRSRGEVDASLPWLDAAEAEAERLGDPSARAYLENARGQLRVGQGAPSEGRSHLLRALDAAEDARARVTIRVNLAEALLAEGRALEAAQACRDAEEEAVRAGVIARLPEVYRLLGRIAGSEGDPDAFVLFERALEIARERRLPALQEAVTLQAYAEHEVARGDPEAAAELERRARERFAELGIEGPRHPWMDAFGAGNDRTDSNDGDLT